MKWIDAYECGTSPSGKTRIWEIGTREAGILLGYVKWHAPWRKYAFFPVNNTLYEPDCLRDLADFCEQATQTHRKAPE